MPARVMRARIVLALAFLGTIIAIAGGFIFIGAGTAHDVDRGFIVMLCGIGLIGVGYVWALIPHLECIRDEKEVGE